MSQITTHVLDAALGRPAVGVTVALQERTPEGWAAVGKGERGHADERGVAAVDVGQLPEDQLQVGAVIAVLP